ncbi:cholesterol 24-hydroxylase-like [Stylophora pistillata]|nr:cholesterol 24-hydroxylase-like [Stylophora pistillata]
MATFMISLWVCVTSLAALIAAIFSGFSIYLAYLHWKYSHIPGPKRDSFFSGNLPYILTERAKGKTIFEMVDELHGTHGPVVLLFVFNNPFTFVSDPELVRKCVITLNLPKNPRVYAHLGYPFGQRLAGRGVLNETDHDVWQKRRALLNPAFHRRYLMNLMSSFNDSCNLFLEKLGEMADGKTVVNMAEEFARVTLDVIGKVAFNVDVDTIQDANSPFPSSVYKCLKGVMLSLRTPFWRISVSTFADQRSVIEACQFIRNFGKKVILDRQEAVLRGENTPPDILTHILSVKEKQASITTEDLVDDFVTFFVAGQETTSNQLSFTLYEILRHPNVENRIVKEIEDILGSRQFLEYKDLGNLQFLGQTLKEGLGLHPPIGGITRVSTRDENIGGYIFPAGTSVNISQFLMHRHSDSWKDPLQFDPDRFSPEAKGEIPHSVYFPFSLGPRTCIGQTFAQIEARVFMARLLQQFELTLCPGQDNMKHEEALTLRPKGGVLCTLKRRNEN